MEYKLTEQPLKDKRVSPGPREYVPVARQAAVSALSSFYESGAKTVLVELPGSNAPAIYQSLRRAREYLVARGEDWAKVVRVRGSEYHIVKSAYGNEYKVPGEVYLHRDDQD